MSTSQPPGGEWGTCCPHLPDASTASEPCAVCSVLLLTPSYAITLSAMRGCQALVGTLWALSKNELCPLGAYDLLGTWIKYPQHREGLSGSHFKWDPPKKSPRGQEGSCHGSGWGDGRATARVGAKLCASDPLRTGQLWHAPLIWLLVQKTGQNTSAAPGIYLC